MWTITAWALGKCAHDYFVDVTSFIAGEGHDAEESQQ
jgi:hypothetical protein